ncbi:MAG: TIGR02530 family flagellar biosynthesis protein [Calditrichia bacterium]
MPGKIDGMKPPFIPIGGLGGIPSRKPDLPSAGESEFSKILLDKMADEKRIKFSAHAQTRLHSRNIELNAESMEKLANAINMAQGKGGHDSLILMPDVAFIVNLDNRTVVTAIDNDTMKQNVFTNIDSAVVVE